MARDVPLRPLEEDGPVDDAGSRIDRRTFMAYTFNASAGMVGVSLGVLGFFALLKPGGGGSGGDDAVLYWVPKGAEDSVWYGDRHQQSMQKSHFMAAAAGTPSGMSGAQGVWKGLPVNAVYVPDSANAGTPAVENAPRFQYGEGVDAAGNPIGSGDEIVGTSDQPTDDLIVAFSRCPHLCCIPGWQLVSQPWTADNWSAGASDNSGNKLFCICHSSRFDPTMIEKNTNVNRGDGSQFEYFGIRRTGGPAPVGLPLVPYDVNGDVIEGRPDHLEWYTYCD